jgi:hypothetical protein
LTVHFFQKIAKLNLIILAEFLYYDLLYIDENLIFCTIFYIREWSNVVHKYNLERIVVLFWKTRQEFADMLLNHTMGPLLR